MPDSVLYAKSKSFAIRIVRLYQFLISSRNEFVLSKQILRSGTSIGANLAEASRAVSRADFRAIVHVAAKECAETQYWLDLLVATRYITPVQYESLSRNCGELGRMLTAATKTLSSSP